MLPLFAYGTLRDPDFQRELFGRTLPIEPARLADFIVLSTGGGYLAAVPRAGESVEGSLLTLDSTAYAVADAWEDLTVYARVETVAVCADERRVPCCVYVRPGASGVPVADGRLADRPRADVIADIRRFRAEFDLSRRR